jgi:hypothetical protein
VRGLPESAVADLLEEFHIQAKVHRLLVELLQLQELGSLHRYF